MRGRSYYQPPGLSTSGRAYAEVFVRRVHHLIGRGYARLTPAEFADSEEEDITGELVRAVDAVLDEPSAARWMRWFSIHEEPRIHHAGRRGKRRLRCDIGIDSSQTQPRARMRFEAKRLDHSHSEATYLGCKGMQRFLDGRYSRDDACAGMLGYVQTGDPEEWAARIERAIRTGAADLCVRTTCVWCQEQLAAELPFTYHSSHERPKVGRPIEIFHALLRFN